MKRLLHVLFCLMVCALFAAAAVPFAKEIRAGSVTLMVLRFEKPQLADVAAQFTATEGITVHMQSTDPATVEFRVTARVKLADGRVTVKSDSVRKFQDGWTWLHFGIGKTSEVLSVTVDEVAAPKTVDFE